MLLNKYLEKVFKVMSKRDKEKKVVAVENYKNKKYCSNFNKGQAGFCRYYIGCKVNLTSCSG